MNEVFTVLIVFVATQAAHGQPVGPNGHVPLGIAVPSFAGPNPYPYGRAPPRATPPIAPRPSLAAAAPASAPTIAPSPSIFDLNQAIIGVRSEVHLAQGNSAIGAIAPFPFSTINAFEKAKGVDIALRGVRAAQRHLVRTTNATLENRNKLDDLKLHEVAVQAQKNRRVSQAIPGKLGILAKPFDQQAHEAWLVMNQNKLFDARQAYAKDPSSKNWLAVRSARDAITVNRNNIDGDRSDILAAVGGPQFSSLAVIGPLKRKDASAVALRAERRNNKQLDLAFAKDPSENNWWNLRLSNVKLRALKNDLKAEEGEVLTAPALASIGFGGLGIAAGVAIQNAQYQFEEQNWKRYNQLLLANLLRMRAQSANQAQAAALAQGSSVPARMAALSTYGEVAVPRGPVAPRGPPLPYGQRTG